MTPELYKTQRALKRPNTAADPESKALLSRVSAEGLLALCKLVRQVPNLRAEFNLWYFYQVIGGVVGKRLSGGQPRYRFVREEHDRYYAAAGAGGEARKTRDLQSLEAEVIQEGLYKRDKQRDNARILSSWGETAKPYVGVAGAVAGVAVGANDLISAKFLALGVSSFNNTGGAGRRR